jgi:hypothetical protein
MGMDIIELGYMCFPLKKLLAAMEKAGMGKTESFEHVSSLIKKRSANIDRQIVPWDCLGIEADFNSQVATLLNTLIADQDFCFDSNEEFFGLLNPLTLLSSTCAEKEHWWFAIADLNNSCNIDELRQHAWPKSLGDLVELEFSYASV